MFKYIGGYNMTSIKALHQLIVIKAEIFSARSI